MPAIDVLAVDVPLQVVLSGSMRGLAFGVMAVGVILIYRSCRVINLALGELGALASAVFVRLVVNWHWNFYAALVVTVVAGTLLGGLLELALVRRLFRAPRVVLLVATIGAAQLLLFLQFVLPDIASYEAFPTAFERNWDVGDVIVRADHVVAGVVLPCAVAALAWFLHRTRLGVAVRASADNPDAARLTGIGVKRVSTIVWALAGALVTVATVLSLPLAGANVASTGDLGPGILLRILAAAVIAGMASMSIAVVAGISIGIVEAVLFYNVPDDPGLINAVLLVVVLVAVLVASARNRRLGGGERFSFTPRVRPIPPSIQDLWWVRHHGRIGAGLCLVVAIGVPLVVTAPSRQYLYARVLLMALVALSLTVLTGWAGQLSLGQFALVGIGGMTTYALVQNRMVLPVAILLAVGITALAAVAVGAPALRMHGLYLAVTTLALAVAAPWLLSREIFLDPDQFSPLLRRPVVAGIDLSSQRTYYYLCLVALALGIIVTARIRASGLGRRLLAVRDNESAAASMGIGPARTKLFAFAVSGALAGLAGGALVGLLVQFSPSDFQATPSLTVVAIAVVGGLASITGTVLGSLFVVGLPAFFPDSPQIGLLTSGIGLLVLLLYFPGGLVQILYNLRDAVFAAVARRRPPVEAVRPRLPVAGGVLTTRAEPDHLDLALTTERLTVEFGTRVAVRDVSIEIRPGEVVGLIGTNGAGKSTLMNAIGGYVPSTGSVRILGHAASTFAPHRRAALGLGRTFQDAALFPDLTVREAVQVSVETRAPARLVPVVLGLPRAGRVERAKRAHADEILDFLGLGAYGERFVSELSTGMRRIVELACLLGNDARLLCLDEPTAGVAQREAEAFGPLLLRIRRELDATMLVIEHDMPLVMGISDRIYCLEQGAVISEGDPGAVRSDPSVVASYLGTDPRAIERSGSGLEI